jgi:hypothetical protein
MSSEIIQSYIAYEINYDAFEHVNFIFFTKFHFHYFEDYLMTNLSDLRVFEVEAMPKFRHIKKKRHS